MITVTTDLSRFTGAGFGTVRLPAGVTANVGNRIAVTDDAADTVEATVLEVRGDRADVRADWNRILHRA